MMKSVRFCSERKSSPIIFGSKILQHNAGRRETTSLKKSKTGQTMMGILKAQKRQSVVKVNQEKLTTVIQLRNTFIKQYNSLLWFYETNEDKLGRIITKELVHSKDYVYPKQLSNFIKTGNLDFSDSATLDCIRRGLIKIIEFLNHFSARKKIRQVEIIKQSMICKQKMLRQTGRHEDIERIWGSGSQPFMSSGYTIYDQYKNIRADFNLPVFNRTQQELYNKMCEAEQLICKLTRRKTCRYSEQNDC